MMATSHGTNDAQKVMGIITLSLVAAGIQEEAEGEGYAIPTWVKLACASAIALGTSSGGWRIIKTMGNKVAKLQPIHGFAAETSASAILITTAWLGMPVSTTHVISGAIMGVGASKRLSAVRWTVAGSILVAWVLTIPASAVMGALAFAIIRSTGVA
jgi:PiT family inorganic phosphate transporter